MNLSNADALEIAMIANVAKQILIVNYSVDVHAQNKAQAKMVLDFEIWRGKLSNNLLHSLEHNKL